MSRTFLNTAVAAACVCHSLGRKVCFARLPSPASTHIRHLGPYRPFTINIDRFMPFGLGYAGEDRITDEPSFQRAFQTQHNNAHTIVTCHAYRTKVKVSKRVRKRICIRSSDMYMCTITIDGDGHAGMMMMVSFAWEGHSTSCT